MTVRQQLALGGILALVVASTGSVMAVEQLPPRSRPYLSASQGLDYVCRVTLYTPGFNSTGGAFGFLWLEFSQLPGCKGIAGGAYGSGGIFSERATHEDSDPAYVVSEALLHTYFLMLQRAADTNQRVRWFRCSDTKQGCIRALGIDATAAE